MTKPVSRKMAVDCLLYWFGVMHVTILCPECGEPILPEQNIQFDHRHAIVHNGPHEYQNLRPIHYDPCHKAKTKRDNQANAKVKRIRDETKRRVKPKPVTRPMGKRPPGAGNGFPPKGSTPMRRKS